LIEGLGLYAKKDNVEGTVKFFGGDRRGLEGEVSVRAENAKAFAAETLRAGGPNQKGDIASCLCEPCSKVAADSAGTNDKNLHRILDARACAAGVLAAAVCEFVG
jgi:hypothetical protein